jgi:predicted GTPase
VINKIDTADKKGVEEVKRNLARLNPGAIVIEAASPVTVEDPAAIRGKRVLVVEDGPTLTHGEMRYGAGVIAAQRFGAAVIVDPRPWAVGSIAATFEKYPDIGTLLPAVGYGEQQMDELRQTIERVDCDLVLIATPIDLRRTIRFVKPALKVSYELQEIGKPDLDDVLSVLF